MNTSTETAETPAKELAGVISEIKDDVSGLKGLGAEIKTLKETVQDLRRSRALNAIAHPRKKGGVSDNCARQLAAHFILHCMRGNKLEALASLPNQREALINFAGAELGISTRSALTTGDIPLPSVYGNEVRELISDFGIVRQKMMP